MRAMRRGRRLVYSRADRQPVLAIAGTQCETTVMDAETPTRDREPGIRTAANDQVTSAVRSQRWEAPAFREIKMDAEIGSYQEDYDRRGNVP